MIKEEASGWPVLRRWAMPHLADLDRITGELLRSRATEERYEHPQPGDLLHVDVKKLGRIPDGGGWRLDGAHNTDHRRSRHLRSGFDFVHVAVDDHSASPTPRSTPTRRPLPARRSCTGRSAGSATSTA